MKLRGFLQRRRDHIRSRVFNSRRGGYFISDGGLDREAAKGFIFAVPFLFVTIGNKSLPVLILLGVPAAAGAAYGLFALCVGWKAWIERGDTTFDKHTKYHLLPEYRNTESHTRAKRRSATKSNGRDQ